MQFTTTFSLMIFALIGAVQSDIIAFSGNFCDGSEGSNVKCDGSCIGFGGRHSYNVLASGTHCVSYFLNSGCSVEVGSNENVGGGSCSNVNTGTAVNSIICSPNNFCQDGSQVAGNRTLSVINKVAETSVASSTVLA